jgi:cell division protein FtsB
MDWVAIASALSYILFGVGGWLLKTLWNAVENLRRDLAVLQENVGKNYVPRNEMQAIESRIVEEIRDFRREMREDLKLKADK